MSLALTINYGRPGRVDPTGGDHRPHGGIVSALLSLSHRLATRGHDVSVFGPVGQSQLVGDVWFHDRSSFAARVGENPPDVLVAIPEVLPLLLPVSARGRAVWTGNAHKGGDCALAAPWAWAPDLGERGLRARLWPLAALGWSFDKLLVKSHWQAEYLAATQGVPAGSMAVVYNGVPLHLFRGPAPDREPRRLVYTSQARRGLALLLELLPRIQAEVPGTELHLFGYELGGNQAPAQPSPAGVVWHGSLGKAELARELRRARAMAYPCTFKETFCTAVAEAQAAGLPVVTSDRAALPERVADGVDGLVIPWLGGMPDEPPGGTAFGDSFVAAAVRLLTDDALWRRQSEAASARAFREYDWDRIVQRWEAILEELAAGPATTPRLDAARDLLDPALLKVEEQGRTAEVPAELAERWLREAWASYGYDPSTIPGL